MFSKKIQIARPLLSWYDRHRRNLPWRVAPGARPDPYHVLLSETMLQQTQVKTALPYFRRFVERLPTLADVAAAPEQLVLRLWQGLGYYSRARNLRAAAQLIVREHGGQVPRQVEPLLKLPGIGRYTAGAVASIAYDTRAPIVDANVARVICRLDRITSDPRLRQTQKQLWHRAEQMLPDSRAGDFNSALMELGSTICTPRSPQCLVCPVRGYCEAFAAGEQERIPAPRKSKPTPLFHRRTFCLSRMHRGQRLWLLEQRPARGRWAGLWQFITVESDDSTISPSTAAAAVGIDVVSLRRIAIIEHALTHRRYRFQVFVGDAKDKVGTRAANPHRRWLRLEELEHYPLPRPHVRIVELLRS